MRYWLCLVILFYILFFVFGIQLSIYVTRRKTKVTKLVLLRPGIRYWFLLDYKIFYMLNYSILWLMFCFWDTVVRVIKAKYKVNKINVIKAKYQLLVIANLLIYYFFYMLNYSVLYMFLCFGETVIDFGLKRCQRQFFSSAENVIKIFSVGRKNSI